jgi:hypothetical protein
MVAAFPPMSNIQIATIPSEIDRCFPVMRQLDVDH